MHLQENYEIEEFYIWLSHDSTMLPDSIMLFNFDYSHMLDRGLFQKVF